MMQYMIWPEIITLVLNNIIKIIGIILIVYIICFILDRKKSINGLYIFIKKILSVIVIYLSGIFALLFLVASFFAPHHLSIYPLELSQASNLATSINGLMSPFIAIAAAILTFMAFWVQYSANQNIHRENKKQQDERQFYEMLKIHRDNVAKLEFVHLESEEEANYNEYVHGFHVKYMGEKRYILIHSRGQKAIQFFLKEFKCIYKAIETVSFKKKEDFDEGKERFRKAYDVFFNGLSPCQYLDIRDHECKRYKNGYKECNPSNNDECLCKKKIEINKEWRNKDALPRSSIMDGHKVELNPYYRHLYSIVKSVVDSNFNKPEKEKYLNILRASLTAEEQALLLFNWYYGKILGSGYGLKWEFGSQKFFTKWKMIHNIVKKDFDYIEGMESFGKIGHLLDENIKEYDKEKLKKLFEEYL